MKCSRHVLMFVLWVAALGCSAKAASGGAAGAAANPFGTAVVSGPIGAGGNPVVPTGVSAMPMGTGGVPVFKPPTAGTGGMTALPGTGGALASAGTGGMAAGGAGGKSGAGGTGGAAAGGTGGTTGGGGNHITGTLGSTPVPPIMAAFWIQYGTETIVYLSTVPLTCMQMQTGGTMWLPSVQAGGQVIEIVIPSTSPTVGTAVTVGLFQGEVNYAATGGPSALETTASGGSITYTMFMPMGVAEGMIMATYAAGGSVMGTFHAQYCANASQY